MDSMMKKRHLIFILREFLWEGEDENAPSTMKDDIKQRQQLYSYMVFNLLCMPCFAAVGATKRELKVLGSLQGAAVGTQMLTAYIVAFVVYTVGSLIA